MPEQKPNLPATTGAPTSLALRVGSQQLSIPGEAKQVLLTRTADGWTSKEVGTLGVSDVFINRDPNGVFTMFYKDVNLYEKKREITKIITGWDAKNNKADPTKDVWAPSIEGYNRLNQYAALKQVEPPLVVDGREVMNPYPERENGIVKRLIAKKGALGFSPGGNLVITIATVVYDLDAYYFQDLFKKAKGKKGELSPYARFGSEVSCPFDRDAEIQRTSSGTPYVKTKTCTYVFKRSKDDEGIWIDDSSPEIMEVYAQHNKHLQFDIRTAASMAWRNAIKVHPAIAITTVVPKKTDGGMVAIVPVYCYRHASNEDKLKKIMEQIAHGESVQDAHVEEVTVSASSEEVMEEMSIEEAGQDGNDEGVGTADAPIPGLSGLDLVAKVQDIAKEKEIDLNTFSNNLFKKAFVNLNDEQLTELIPILEKAQSGKKPPKEGQAK